MNFYKRFYNIYKNGIFENGQQCAFKVLKKKKNLSSILFVKCNSNFIHYDYKLEKNLIFVTIQKGQGNIMILFFNPKCFKLFFY